MINPSKNNEANKLNVAPNYSYIEYEPETWADVKHMSEKLPYYIFRGQSNYDWGLETKFKRVCDRYSLPKTERAKREKWMLDIFRSRANLYIQNPPQKEETIEWLAFMQHYGAPTRLLDFTNSYYVAAFFAVDQAEQDASIWAVSELALFMKFFERIKKITDNNEKLPFGIGETYSFFPFDPIPSIRYAETVFSKNKQTGNFVLRISPPKLNERLAVQQGLFLFSGNIDNAFEENLCNYFDLPFDSFKSEYANKTNGDLISATNIADPKTIPLDELAGLFIHAPVIKIKIPKKIHSSAIEDLNRMNINNASLFPGLDGFSRDLSHYLIPGNRMQFSIGFNYIEKTDK